MFCLAFAACLMLSPPLPWLDQVLLDEGVGLPPRAEANPDWLGEIDPASIPLVQRHLSLLLERPGVAGDLAANVALVTAVGDATAILEAALFQPMLKGRRGFPPVVHRKATEGHAASFRPYAELDLDEETSTKLEQALAAVWDALLLLKGGGAMVDRSDLADVSTLLALPVGGEVSDLSSCVECLLELNPPAAMMERMAAAEDLLVRRLVAGEVEESAGGGYGHVTGVVVGSTSPDIFLCTGREQLIFDPGGDDVYVGPCARASAENGGVSVIFDLSGNDIYVGVDGSLGAGLGGVALLLDVAGNDVYVGGKLSLGVGLAGVGVLIDEAGSDAYVASYMAEGAGQLGAGALLDLQGDDRYFVMGDGQGFGSVGGGGLLADLDGDDSFVAEPFSWVSGRGDYHSENGMLSVSNSQGMGLGRRGDLLEGVLLAGGTGILADAGGSDIYEAGSFSMGSGFFLGIGFLVDLEGSDIRFSGCFSQAAAAHWSVGVELDLGGDDLYAAWPSARSMLAYSWDRSVSLFADCSGDDLYYSPSRSMAVAERRSFSVAVECSGSDGYMLGEPSLGAATPDSSCPARGYPSCWLGRQWAVFLDLGGDDAYWGERGREDGSKWLGSSGEGAGFAVGLDGQGSCPQRLCSLKRSRR